MKILKESEDEDAGSFETMLEFLINSIESKSEKCQVERTYNNRVILENYLNFFMILTLNLKNYPVFITAVFKGENIFFPKLIDYIIKLKDKNIFLSIINNLFADEYKCVFFKDDPNLDVSDLYEEGKESFQKILPELPKKLENVNDKESYIQLFSKILNFDIDYTNFFHEDNGEKIDPDEKSAYKLTIVQSIIRIIFSNQKKNYTNEKFYGFNTLKRIIDKDIIETKEKYGDQFKTLFRKEDLCDDFLKYIFFIFGNKMMVESFVNPVRKDLRKIGFKNRDIKKEEFDNFVTAFIDNLNKSIPNVLKVLLKLLYESVKSHFTIDEDNYGPLYTTLIFNYFINPRVQSIFNINSQKSDFVRSLNRILRNACFNFKFSESDPLNIFNDIIEKNHLKIKNYIKENIIGINIEDETIKSSLENIFNDDNSIFPNYLFYSDSNLLINSIKEGIVKVLKSEELKNGEDSNEWVVLNS